MKAAIAGKRALIVTDLLVVVIEIGLQRSKGKWNVAPRIHSMWDEPDSRTRYSNHESGYGTPSSLMHVHNG
jgi:hypothetical protein